MIWIHLGIFLYQIEYHNRILNSGYFKKNKKYTIYNKCQKKRKIQIGNESLESQQNIGLTLRKLIY